MCMLRWRKVVLVRADHQPQEPRKRKYGGQRQRAASALRLTHVVTCYTLALCHPPQYRLSSVSHGAITPAARIILYVIQEAVAGRGASPSELLACYAWPHCAGSLHGQVIRKYFCRQLADRLLILFRISTFCTSFTVHCESFSSPPPRQSMQLLLFNAHSLHRISSSLNLSKALKVSCQAPTGYRWQYNIQGPDAMCILRQSLCMYSE